MATITRDHSNQDPSHTNTLYICEYHVPGTNTPTQISRNPSRLREFSKLSWGTRGGFSCLDLATFVLYSSFVFTKHILRMVLFAMFLNIYIYMRLAKQSLHSDKKNKTKNKTKKKQGTRTTRTTSPSPTKTKHKEQEERKQHQQHHHQQNQQQQQQAKTHLAGAVHRHQLLHGASVLRGFHPILRLLFPTIEPQLVVTDDEKHLTNQRPFHIIRVRAKTGKRAFRKGSFR